MTFSPGIYVSWQKLQKEKFIGMKKHLGPLADQVFTDHILDVGCGFGYLEREFKGTFIGIDKDMSMLKNSVEIFPKVLGTAEDLPFKDEAFDSVVSVDTMHSVEGSDFQRILKDGGFALLSIFFNDQNYSERKELLRSKVEGMELLLEFEMLGREKEYVIVARK
ncbi:MAG TPA: class I SAM-dependent methyltransferase [archaeon]|nr:class I SAM-dependent methyltransferase [archaeon]